MSSPPMQLARDMPVSAETILNNDESLSRISSVIGQKHWKWWFLVALNIFFLLAGQAAAVILGRFYYDEGGNSKWISTFVQTAAFPILLIPLFFLPPTREPSTTAPPSCTILASIYLILGVVLAGDNMLYSTGLLYLTASTYSLTCATQLAFNAVFSFYINSQKFTALILNSVIVLSLSAALIAVNENSVALPGISKDHITCGLPLEIHITR